MVAPLLPGADDLGHAEVEYLHMPAGGDEDVRRLDVAMNDARGVGGVEGVGDFDGQFQRRFEIEPLDCHALAQVRALEELHGDEDDPVLLANLINRADVGVVQSRQSARFTLKARYQLCIAGQFRLHHLDGDIAVQIRVVARYTSPIPPEPSSSTMV